ncbi:MAG: DUF3784 domain-containing protein [Eubacteriales bacterium]|nr:DUF3784 domain-containing protein [Eubacteriales bacterium]
MPKEYSVSEITDKITKRLFVKERCKMSVVALLSGVTLIAVGVLIWRFKMVDILAGYKKDNKRNDKVLATMVGLALVLFGALLLVESLLIYKQMLIGTKAILTVVGTMVIGVSVVGIVASYYSNR